LVKEQRMFPVRSRLYCDECGTEMKYVFVSTLTDPQKHKHMCPKCKYSDYYDTIYPTFEYIEEDATDTREFDDVIQGVHSKIYNQESKDINKTCAYLDTLIEEKE
jgi:hypothetical protein